MSVRVTITRPRLDDKGEPILDGEGQPVTDDVLVDRAMRLHVGDTVVEDWDWDDLPFNDAVAIEAAYGGTLAELRAAITSGSQTAKQVFAWTILRRDNPQLRVGEVNLPIGAVYGEIVDTDVVTGEESEPEVKSDPTEAASTDPASPPSETSTSPTSTSTTESDPGSGD